MLGSKTRKAVVAVALVALVVIASVAFLSGGGGAQDDSLSLQQPSHQWSSEADTWYHVHVDDRSDHRYVYGTTGANEFVRYNITTEEKETVPAPLGTSIGTFEVLENHPDTEGNTTAVLYTEPNDDTVTVETITWNETGPFPAVSQTVATMPDTRQAADYHPGPSGHDGYVVFVTRDQQTVNGDDGWLWEWDLDTDQTEGSDVQPGITVWGHEMAAVAYPQAEGTPTGEAGDRRIVAMAERTNGGKAEMIRLNASLGVLSSEEFTDVLGDSEHITDMVTESSGWRAGILSDEGHFYSLDGLGEVMFSYRHATFRSVEYVDDQHLFLTERYATVIESSQSLGVANNPVRSFSHDIEQAPHTSSVGSTDMALAGYIGMEVHQVYNELGEIDDIRINAESTSVVEGGGETSFTIEALDSNGDVVATIYPSDAVWDVEDDSVVELSQILGEDSITVTGQSVGSTQVSVYWDVHEATQTFEVTEDFIESIELDVSPQIGYGDEESYTVTAEYASGDTEDVTDDATVFTDNATVLNVDQSSHSIIGRSEGTADLEATVEVDSPDSRYSENWNGGLSGYEVSGDTGTNEIDVSVSENENADGPGLVFDHSDSNDDSHGAQVVYSETLDIDFGSDFELGYDHSFPTPEVTSGSVQSRLILTESSGGAPTLQVAVDTNDPVEFRMWGDWVSNEEFEPDPSDISVGDHPVRLEIRVDESNGEVVMYMEGERMFSTGMVDTLSGEYELTYTSATSTPGTNQTVVFDTVELTADDTTTFNDSATIVVTPPEPTGLDFTVEDTAPDFGAEVGYTGILNYEDGSEKDVTDNLTVETSHPGVVDVFPGSNSVQVTEDEDVEQRVTLTATHTEGLNEFTDRQEMLIGIDPSLSDGELLGPGAILGILITSTTVLWTFVSTAMAGYVRMETGDDTVTLAAFGSLMAVGWLISQMFSWTFVATPMLIGVVIVCGAIWYVREGT